MIKMEKVDRGVLQNAYRKTKWQEVLDQFEREGHDIVKISESGRKVSAIQGCLNTAIKKYGKAGTLVCKVIDRNCYLLRRELLENGR